MEQILMQIKQSLLKYEQKIVFIASLVLISVISFEFGVLQGQKWQQKPLIIEKPVSTSVGNQTSPGTPSSVAEKQPSLNNPAPATNSTSCAFVGSKNSTKFYVPTCTWAKRIKTENMVCYKSEQDAISKGKTKSDCK